MNTLIVIPARLNSTRLPRKLLLVATGKPLICHGIEQASESFVADDVVVACDSDEVVIAVEEFKAEFDDWNKLNFPRVVKTREHPNGTSRAAEIASLADKLCERPDGWWDSYCIVQADYPEISPALIDQVIGELDRHPEWDCATAACRSGLQAWGDSESDGYRVFLPAMNDANRVKVLYGDGIARDFTREPIHDDRLKIESSMYCAIALHIGIYAYRREALLKYAAAGPCQREQDESLEQLRALHIGLKMGVVLTDESPAGIDTREDYDAFVERWKAANVSTG